MSLFLQLLVNVIIPGSVYALIAAGFSLIYSVSRVFHLAHGALVVASGYLFYLCVRLWHLPTALSAVLVICVAMILGVWMDWLVYERLRSGRAASIAGNLIAALSLLFVIENASLALFGADTRTFPEFTGAIHEFGPIIVSNHEIFLVMISFALVIVLALFLKYTRKGKALRAVADHEVVAEVVGISAKRARYEAFAIGSALAAIAGILFAIEYGLEPAMTTMVTMRMFSRAILGGVGSIAGATAGSLVTETFMTGTAWFIGSTWIDFSSFVLIFFVLLIKPTGLLGPRKRKV